MSGFTNPALFSLKSWFLTLLAVGIQNSGESWHSLAFHQNEQTFAEREEVSVYCSVTVGGVNRPLGSPLSLEEVITEWH